MAEKKDTMEKKEFKKVYVELSKKYQLPDFTALDNDFEISEIESERFG